MKLFFFFSSGTLLATTTLASPIASSVQSCSAKVSIPKSPSQSFKARTLALSIMSSVQSFSAKVSMPKRTVINSAMKSVEAIEVK